MKKIFLMSLAALSMNAFSQSYVVLSNGVLLTTDKAGYVYDLVQYVNPYRVSVNGGSYLVQENKLSTVSDGGYYFEKDLKLKKIRGKGLSYLMDKDGDLITVAADGTYVEYKDSGKVLKNADRFGGNFFTLIDKKKKISDLYTVDSKGAYFKVNVEGLKPSEISLLGGTYFMANGIMYTVNKDGFVASKPMFNIPALKKMGGNFFVDFNNALWTISEEGLLSNPLVPENLDVNKIDKVGANYMIDTDGNIFTVDNMGNISYRNVNMHDLSNAKILSR